MNAHQRRQARRHPQSFETISTLDRRGKWTSRRRRAEPQVWTGPASQYRGTVVPFPRHVTVLVDLAADGTESTVMLDTSDPTNVKVWSAFKTETPDLSWVVRPKSYIPIEEKPHG